jgi:hypothetical protein
MAIELLRKWDFPFFLDSGSLLALYREGKFFAHDDDVDLFLDVVHVDKMFNYFDRNEVSYRIQKYNAKVVKVIVPASPSHKRIDVHVFTKKDEFYSSPAYKWKAELNFLKRLYRRLYFYVRPHLSNENLDALKRYGLIELKFWTYPAHFFEVKSELQGLSIPKDIESYLNYRYGDGWRFPAPNWNYWIDDNALRNE